METCRYCGAEHSHIFICECLLARRDAKQSIRSLKEYERCAVKRIEELEDLVAEYEMRLSNWAHDENEATCDHSRHGGEE